MKTLIFFSLLFTVIGTYGQDVDNKLQIGTVAPDFNLIDNDNNVVSLSSFKGKVVLIDFWASYCGPCRQQYQTFFKPLHDYLIMSNFDIIGITLDKDSDKWLSAIDKDGLSWPQLSARLNSNSVLSDYGVAYIPQTMLIDADGRVLGMNLTKSDLTEKIYNHIDNDKITFEGLEQIASNYISWEEFWIDLDYEVKNYLFENTKYPKAALENKITGCIPVLIRIGNDFRLEYRAALEYVPGTNNQKKVEHLGFGCEEEARRVIDTMGEWRSWPYVQKENIYSLTVDVCFPPKPPIRKRIEDFKYN